MPRIVDHEQRRREIVAAAIALIEESGPGALTMRALAERLGVANGAIDRYFRGKSAILEAVYAEAYRRLRAETERAVEGLEPGLAMLRAMVVALLPAADRSVAAAVVLAYWNRLADSEPVRGRVGHDLAHMRDHFERLLRAAADRGEVTRPERIPAVALALFTLVSGAYHVQLSGAVEAEVDFSDAVDLVLATL